MLDPGVANGHDSCSLFQGFGVRVARGSSAGVNTIELASLFRPTSELLSIRKPGIVTGDDTVISTGAQYPAGCVRMCFNHAFVPWGYPRTYR